jgi:GNAT superfamily N-acetyltransferase
METRWAEDRDVGTLALFRWQWGAEHQSPTEGIETFRGRFSDWLRSSGLAHQALVAEVDGELIGMAWLACVTRLPDPDRAAGLHIDLQSVYIVAHRRGMGFGGLLVDDALEAARDMGATLVTVRAGRRSLPFYKRHGFEPSEGLLQINLESGHDKPAITRYPGQL